MSVACLRQWLIISRITLSIAGSIISADNCDTTYRFTCTNEAVCNGRTWAYTLTKGLSTYNVRYTTSTDGTKAEASELCLMHGSYSAVCTETVSYSFSGTKTVTTITTSASGDQLAYGQFPITAGTQKLAKATGVCTINGNAAAPTRNVEVLKVLVVPAAAMVAGMIG